MDFDFISEGSIPSIPKIIRGLITQLVECLFDKQEVGCSSQP